MRKLSVPKNSGELNPFCRLAVMSGWMLTMLPSVICCGLDAANAFGLVCAVLAIDQR